MTKKKTKAEDLLDSYDYLANSASSTDCTGLIPSAPHSEAELDAYNDVYKYTPPVVKDKNAVSENPPK